jgi:gliding motility-associated-like protein
MTIDLNNLSAEIKPFNNKHCITIGCLLYLTRIEFGLKKLFVLLFIFGSVLTDASHIVGGELSYKYISKANNGDVTYSVTLSLYLDCKNGTPTSIASDASAFFNVFDAKTGTLIKSLCKTVTRQNPIRVSANAYKCIKNSPDVCVDMYLYTTTMVLPKRTNGYIITFERCCRNDIIVNITNPGATGATYWTEIKPESTIGQNSSPTFTYRPPIFLCLNAPFTFNHSATDEDGDSLVYELFTPYLGASANRSKPDYNSAFNGAPVFPLNNNRLVSWRSPYSVNDEMGGNPILEVDANTGRLTITPDQNGQFVIGIKVKEYRKGVLIGETKRDYQFNVDNCVFDVVSVFYTSKTNCTNKGVSFTNQSSGALDYKWNFGDFTTASDTSHLVSPTYVYSKPGTYKVMLIAKNLVCIDTFDYIITVKENVSTKLGRDTIFCGPATFELNAGTKAVQYLWNTGANTQKINVSRTGNYSVTVSDAPCLARDTILVVIDTSGFNIGQDTTICSPTFMPFVYLAPKIFKSYLWNDLSKADTLQITKPGKYWLDVKNYYNCPRSDTFEVFHIIPPKSQLRDTSICKDYFTVFDAKIPNYTYKWNTGETTRTIKVNMPGIYSVEITNGKCTSADSAELKNFNPQLDLRTDTSFCGPFNFEVETNKTFPSYGWSNGDNKPATFITNAGKVKVTIQTAEGCFESDSFTIINYPANTIQIEGDTAACTSSIIKITGNDSMQYQWNTGETTQSIEVIQDGLYSLIITDKNGCKDTGYHRITKNPNAYPNEMYMPNVFTPNEDDLNEWYPSHKFHDLNAPYKLQIFNRWGQKVFESFKPSENWNGYFQGELSQCDVYIYVVAYHGCDNNSHLLKGSFHLIR